MFYCAMSLKKKKNKTLTARSDVSEKIFFFSRVCLIIIEIFNILESFCNFHYLLKFFIPFSKKTFFSLKIIEISAKYNTIEIRIIHIIGDNSIQNKYNNKIIGK